MKKKEIEAKEQKVKNDKFELTKETKVFFGKTLYRIKALRTFGGVVAGELGGFIEKTENLAASCFQDDAGCEGLR